MTTNLFTTTPAARDVGYPVVEALRKKVNYLDNGTAVVVGVIPPGALVIGGGAFITTAFNAGTSNTLNVGHADATADDNAFGTLLALGALGYIVLDELAATTNTKPTVERTITATVVLTGTAATAGEAEVIVQFVGSHDSPR